jgi:hypothetical protein
MLGSRRRIWLLAPAAALLLVGVALWFRSTVGEALEHGSRDRLQATLRATRQGLLAWYDTQQDMAVSLARNGILRAAIGELLQVQGEGDAFGVALAASPAQATVRERLGILLEGTGVKDCLITDARGRLIASASDGFLGSDAKPLLPKLTEWPPGRQSHTFGPLRDRKGEVVMVASGVVSWHAGGQRPAAVMHLFVDPARGFNKILVASRTGDSGKTYAFDRQGHMLSESRFATQLQDQGLLPSDSPTTTLNLVLREPPADGAKAEGPLTLPVREAPKGGDGSNVEGYTDFRGETVVGAWTWLKDYDIGLVTEIDAEEAFALQHTLNRANAVLFLLLAIALGLAVAGSHYSAKQKKRSERAELKVKALGQYTLERKLGEGGMGAVFVAHHAMLRRPTAIKMLKDSGSASSEMLARFEREVRITAALTHPNTVAIYDYGKTPDGTFYYAMELLGGHNLDTLVERCGPLPPARVVHLLLQACGSLQEAHGAGLIHRDIKPANLILCERGGVADTLKVLDFGLVKRTNEGNSKLTAVNSIMGTPAFLAPEVISDGGASSALSDIYALGATAYYLLTGKLLFEGKDVMQILMAQVNEAPTPPSKHVEGIPADLEAVVLRCLVKMPEGRPQTTEKLADALAECACAGEWTQREARAWWAVNGPKLEVDPLQNTAQIAATLSIDLKSRA